MKTVYLDLETTGKYPNEFNNEILEIAIVDDDGHALINSLVKPVKRKRWPSAQEVHGITPGMVKDSPTLNELMPNIIEALEGNKVVIYNAEFDIGFLPEIETHAAEIWCCMKSWADSYNAGRWQKLTVAAKAVGYQFNAHRALDDCLATRAVWQYLMAKRKRVKAKPKPPSDYPWIPKLKTKHKPSIGRRIWTALCWLAAIWVSLKFAGFVLGI